MSWWGLRAPCGRWREPIDLAFTMGSRRAAAGYLRHRRRRPFDIQYFDRCGVRGGGRGRARGQAWQPLHFQPVRQRRPAGGDGRAHPHVTGRECARAIREIGIGFLFAPAIHTAARHAHPVRVDLKMRTVFNLLGPLTNPAGASAQLAGAPSAHSAELIAGALAALGLERGFVVHGSDGLDEITTTGPTLAFEIRNGAVKRRTLTPDDFGVAIARPEDLKGGDRERNCEIAREILEGARGPQRDIVLVNAAAALVAAGRARDFREGVALAARAIDSGAARGKAEALARFTQSPSPEEQA